MELAAELTASESAAIHRLCEETGMTIGVAALVLAAEEAGLDVQRRNLRKRLSLGRGNATVRINGSITAATTRRSRELASNKYETVRALRAAGLPAPRQRRVQTLQELERALEGITGSSVVKPLDSKHGNGVITFPVTATDFQRAFLEARKYSETVLLEQWLPGADHRFLVVDGKVVATARRIPGHVVGDGVSTVKELVQVLNRDPRRGAKHKAELTRIRLDDEADRTLLAQGLDRKSVPPKGERVSLRKIANLSVGGEAIDVSQFAHPENIEIAAKAATVIGLDIAGVDILCPDITQPMRLVGGGICEVNSGPGLRMHLAPSEGIARNVGRSIIAYIEQLMDKIELASL
jgi:cyanophycin synthetase